MKTLTRLTALATATAAFGVLGTVPAYAATQQSCSSGYMNDKVAGKAYTTKSSHVVGGETAGIDDFMVVCDVDAWQDADNIVDLYSAGQVYKYASGSYTSCFIYTGTWAGWWVGNMGWYIDLDSSLINNRCGWNTGPIKVRNTAKGEWKDGTIKSVATIVTDSKL